MPRHNGSDVMSLARCRTCPRLAAHLATIREDYPDYHAAPVPPWGSAASRLLIVGLAPGLHGANRTGRPFTGDASGEFLFESLHRAGFASSQTPARARLINARITNAVKCLPPGNRPLGSEVKACGVYLAHELDELMPVGFREPRCVLCLGRIAHQAVASELPWQVPPFAHGTITQVQPEGSVGPAIHVADTYHPSRQNTNTRRLTRAMLDQVLQDVRRVLEMPKPTTSPAKRLRH